MEKEKEKKKKEKNSNISRRGMKEDYKSKFVDS